MDLYNGARVKLMLRDTDVIFGYINSINTNEDDSIVALSKVEIWQKGKSATTTRLSGIQRILASEIEDIEILPEAQIKKANKTKTNKKSSEKNNVKYKKRTPIHLTGLTELEPENLIFGKSVSRSGSRIEDDLIKDVFQQNGNSSDSDSSSEVEDSYIMDDFTVLTKIDTMFHEAILYIIDKSVVGFAAEGVDIGRDGKLCWIQIEANGSIFLFDILKLGKECFEQGLKKIIQSESILKVIHDCRLLADLFYHQYRIQMLSVFDTQVAHVFAYREQHHQKDLPRYVPGLASCLYEHLDLPNEQIHIIRIREQAKSEDLEIWAERPAPSWLLEAASKHVKHLMDLRIVLMEKMMVEFIAGVEIYLSYVRNSSDKEAKDCHDKRHLLPLAFRHLHNFVSDLQCRMKNNYKLLSHHPRVKDQHGFIENHTDVIDPKIMASKDSIWHANTNGTVLVNKRIKTPPSDSSVKTTTKSGNIYERQKYMTVKSLVNSELQKEDSNCTKNYKISSKLVHGFSNPDSDTDEEQNTHIVNSSVIQQISSQYSSRKTDPGAGSDLEKEFILRPAGRIQANNPKKKHGKIQYDHHFPPKSNEIMEDDLVGDYGEIPTPERLGRAPVRSISSFTSLEQSLSTSTDEIVRQQQFSCQDDKNEYQESETFNQISSAANNCFIVPKQLLTSENKSILSELQRKLERNRYSSESSSVSVSTSEQRVEQSRLQRLYQVLKMEKKT